MNRKILMTTLALFTGLLGGAAVSSAQENAATKPEISAEKRALIRAILDLTNSTQGTKTMLNAQFDQMDRHLPDLEWKAIAESADITKLSIEQRNAIRAKMNERLAKTSKRMREVFEQRIDLKQMIEDMSYPLYDKYFSESELRDLVTFYKSGTGKRVIEVMPALLAESVTRSMEIMLPKIQEVVREVQEADSKEYEEYIETLMKSTSKPPAKAKPAKGRPAARLPH